MAAQIPLIWITALTVLFFLVIAAGIFVKVYQDHREKDAFVTTVCILALTCLLATVCLFPVDIALVSSTTDNTTGLKKDWANPGTVYNVLVSLKAIYYTLYSVDAVMCLLVIPFAYFWYEEWDEDTTTRKRLAGALRYNIFFVAPLVVMLLVGFFVPVATKMKGHMDLDYFKKLLMENHGERALTFVIGVLMCLGTVLFVVYTASGLALTPMIMINSVPASSHPTISSDVRESVAINRERQRAIEVRYAAGSERPNSRDRRELESLQREERTLVRRQRIAEENDKSYSKKFCLKLQAVGRPFKIAFGLLTLVITVLIFASMLITGIDKILNSTCGKDCGYILPNTNILNPVNWVFVQFSKIYPVDYVLALFVVLLFFVSSIVGISFIGIRFLWVSLFRLRVSRTKPQGLLISTVMLTLIVLALNYAFTMLLFPQYAHYGGQRFCDHSFADSSLYRSCGGSNKIYIRPCDEKSPQDICTPTVVSSFINRITLNFSFFGLFAFWAQFAFMGVFVIFLLTGLVWTPHMGSQSEEDEDAEYEEEESLLTGTGRRTQAAWEDFTGHSSRNYGTENGRN